MRLQPGRGTRNGFRTGGTSGTIFGGGTGPGSKTWIGDGTGLGVGNGGGRGISTTPGTGREGGIGTGVGKGYNGVGWGGGGDYQNGREGYQRVQGGVGVGDLLDKGEIERMGRGKKRYHENVDLNSDSDDDNDNRTAHNHTWGLENEGRERGGERGSGRGRDNEDTGYGSLVPQFTVSLLALVEEATAVTYEHADHRTVVPMTR